MNRSRIVMMGTALVALLVLAVGCAKRPPSMDTEPRTRPETERPERDEPVEPEARPRTEPRLDIENLSLEQLNRMGLLEDIHFAFDRYELRPDALQILRKNAAFLREYPTVEVLIEGHCDERGTNEYNLALGEKRADAARSYLVRIGISPRRLSTVSYGEERPLDPRHNEEAWARNRRAHFRIVDK